MSFNMTRRELLRYLGIGTAGMALAACSPRTTDTPPADQPVAQQPDPASPADQGPVEIRVLTNLGYQWWGWIEEAWETNVDGFRDKHPNIQMVGEPIAGWTADYFPKIFTHVSAGTLGDIVWFPPRMRNHISWGVMYNIVVDHMPFVDAEGYDLGQFYPGVVASSSHEGKLFWMPFRNEASQPVIGYNKTLAEKLGMSEPRDDFTFEEFAEWARSGTTDEVYGYLSRARGFNAWAPELRQFGCEVIDDEGVVAFPGDSVEGLKRAMQHAYDMVYADGSSPLPDAGAGNELWVAEQVVAVPMNVGHMTAWPIMAENKFEVGYFYPPKLTADARRRSSLNEHVHGVTRFSKHPDAAWEWLKWHSSKEFNVGGILSGKVGAVGRPDVFADPRVQEVMPHYSLLAPLMEDIEPDWFARNYRGNELEDESNAVMQAYMLGDHTTNQAAEILANECQLILDKPPA